MMKSDLTFINISGHPQDGDRSNNKTVRSHVMKKYRQQQKVEKNGKPARGRYKVPFYDTGIFSKRAEPQGMRLKLELPRVEAAPSFEESPRIETSSDLMDFENIEDIEGLNTSSRSPKMLDITSLAFQDVDLNAYDFLPVSATPRVLMLLHTNIKSKIRTSVHADPSENYLSYYVDNAARLYMALSYSASRFQDQSGHVSSESLYYLNKSLSAVNDDIADPQKQLSDSTIAAVATMANMENLNGNSQNAVIHLNGLKRMLELRGGLKCLGMRGILQRIVLWADLCGASRTQTLPRFPLVRFRDLQPLSMFSSPSCAASYKLVMNERLSSRVLTHEHARVVETLATLHELSTFLNLVGKESDDLPIEACYPDRVYEVEHNTLTSLADSQSSHQRKTKDIWDVLLHASLLFVYTNLRQTPVGGEIRKSISNRLRLCMQYHDFENYKSDLPAELLWVSCIGLIGAQDTGDYQWFQVCAERICIEHLIGSWEEVMEFCSVMPILERNCAKTYECRWARRIFS